MMGVRQDEMGLDYFETRNDMVNAVSIEDVRRIAAEYLMPENFSFIVVGEPQGLDMISEYYEDSLSPELEETTEE